MRVLDLFSGVGGFSLGLERAGMQTVGFCEIDPFCRQVLAKHWPGVWIHDDVRTLTGELVRERCGTVDLVCGGDPCPKHSRAKSNGSSIHADLSGHFLAVVAGLRPWWVVRENVPAPTVDHFDATLAALGYGTVVIRMDSAPYTGQSRQRDVIVGCYQEARESVRQMFSQFADGVGAYTTRLGERQVAPCLTTHRIRYDSRDCYIWESRGLRILDGEEREALAGFSRGWAGDASEAMLAKVYGNSVDPHIVEVIGRAIMECNRCTC